MVGEYEPRSHYVHLYQNRILLTSMLKIHRGKRRCMYHLDYLVTQHFCSQTLKKVRREKEKSNQNGNLTMILKTGGNFLLNSFSFYFSVTIFPAAIRFCPQCNLSAFTLIRTLYFAESNDRHRSTHGSLRQIHVRSVLSMYIVGNS